ncbi:hypothetical protein LTR37_007190 [Vermiconidia calcicola]|uniref:Uncharacterized protein n=1 Tax=Vermiconidia calcicola TaxID=1690605 RepID=A0ACC3NEE1_9PEZI|nr:hypothetical protein LTR37_007190 [Vermiconidia calcicola]
MELVWWISSGRDGEFLCGGMLRSRQGLGRRPPKRLVYVGTANDDLRLVELGEPSAPPYIALSYSWGLTKRLTCTRDNYKQLRTGIPWSELPRTLQDAISITRRLAMAYLWVDALCIVQGDLTDWQSEPANMASIYANAYLTVSATGSSDCDDGILSKRAHTLKVDITEVSGAQSTVYARKKLNHNVWNWGESIIFSQTARNYIDRFRATKSVPVMRRGWCFQERILSGRILHYTKEEMVWECLGMTSCECGTLDRFAWTSTLRERRYAAGVPSDVEIRCNKLEQARSLDRRMGISRMQTAPRMDRLPSFMQLDEALIYVATGTTTEEAGLRPSMQQRWFGLVQQYSQKRLTNATDALPALSGLAQCWADPNNLGPYLAGLWHKDILRGLLWACTDDLDVARPQGYLAPSWSWASVRRAIDFTPAQKAALYRIEVLDAVCRPAGAHPYGEVESGHIKLKGRLREGVLEAETHPANETLTFGLYTNGYSGRIMPDCVPECLRLVGSPAYFLWCCTDIINQETMEGSERGLVLRKHENSNDTFSRIGIREHCQETDWFESSDRESDPLVQITIV